MKRLKNALTWLLVAIALILLGGKKKKPKDKIYTYKDVEDVLNKKLGKKTFLYVVDEKYYIPTLDEINEFLSWWVKFLVSEKIKYISDFFDCDNFSLLFAAMCLIKAKFHSAIANSYTHSYNMVVYRNGDELDVVVIEPQLGKTMTVDEASKREDYKTVFVYYT